MSIRKFTVVESEWLRGEVNPQGERTSSCLKSTDGYRCCMGFLAQTCGIPDEVLQGRGYFSGRGFEPYDHLLPEALRPRHEETVEYEQRFLDERGHGKLARRIYMINDSTVVTDEVRKEKLTRLFAEAGIEVEFVP